MAGIGEDHAVLLKVLVTRKQNSVQHRLVEEEIAHPLGDDDVKFLDRQFDILELSLDKGNG